MSDYLNRGILSEYHCHVCKNYYREPKLLSCGDSLCAQCVPKPLANLIVCPVCETGMEVPAGGFLTNLLLKEMVEKRMQASQNFTVHLCQECKIGHSMNELWTCHACRKDYICSLCAMKNHRKHTATLMIQDALATMLTTVVSTHQQASVAGPSSGVNTPPADQNQNLWRSSLAHFMASMAEQFELGSTPQTHESGPVQIYDCRERPRNWQDDMPPPRRVLIPPSDSNLPKILSRPDTRPIPSYAYPPMWQGIRDIRYLQEYGWKIPLPMFCTPAGFEWRIEPNVPDSLLDKVYQYYVASVCKTMDRLRRSIYRFNFAFWMAVYCELIYGLCFLVDNDALYQQFTDSQVISFVLSMVIMITQYLAFAAFSRLSYQNQQIPDEIWQHSRLRDFDTMAKIASPLVRYPHQHTTSGEIIFDDQNLHRMLYEDGYAQAPFNEYLINWNGAGKIHPWRRLERGPIYVLAPYRLCTPSAIEESRAMQAPIFENPYEGILPPDSTQEFDMTHRPYPWVRRAFPAALFRGLHIPRINQQQLNMQSPQVIPTGTPQPLFPVGSSLSVPYNGPCDIPTEKSYYPERHGGRGRDRGRGRGHLRWGGSFNDRRRSRSPLDRGGFERVE